MTERDAGIGQDGGRLCGPQKLQLKEEESPTECSGVSDLQAVPHVSSMSLMRSTTALLRKGKKKRKYSADLPSFHSG